MEYDDGGIVEGEHERSNVSFLSLSLDIFQSVRQKKKMMGIEPTTERLLKVQGRKSTFLMDGRRVRLYPDEDCWTSGGIQSLSRTKVWG